jgi:hypothetical protein
MNAARMPTHRLGPRQRTDQPRARQWLVARSLIALALTATGCSGKSTEHERAAPEAPDPAPDRLTGTEQLPEAETAFGLPIPRGMRMTRYFTDAAYFSGSLSMEDASAHVQKFVDANSVEITLQRALFARARIKGDARKRLFRIEISKTSRGSQVHVKDVTPPPATQGLTEAQRWERAGRNPDGTLINPNQVY